MLSFFQRARRSPTLRGRLAFLTSLLIIVVSGGLALFINLYATLESPTSETTALSAPRPDKPSVPRQPGQPSPTPLSIEDPTEVIHTSQYEDSIRKSVLAQFSAISVAGFLVIALLSGFLAYWIAGRALSPLDHVSNTVRQIRASTLHNRVSVDNPSAELRDLMNAFDSMLSNLESSFRQQGHFASLAAHELRTPLAMLQTNLEIVYSDPHSTVEDYRRLVPAVTHALSRMNRLISDLLVMAKDEDALVYEDIDLVPLIAEVLEEMSPLSKEHGVSLSLEHGDDVTPVVHGDPELLNRVFANLIENAIRYNTRGGKVRVEVSQVGELVLVVVEDTGLGISTEAQSNIFASFYRADASRQLHSSGVGLGLSIVAHVVKLHHGDVHVESTPGTGSKFFVQLPVRC